jgi:hypothetical protein
MAMKKIIILCSIFTLMILTTNAYSQNYNSIVIPLQVGENAPVQFETLQIEQIRLLYREIPERNRDANIELRFWSGIVDSDKVSRFMFAYYHNEEFARWRGTRFPIAFQNYAFSLKVDENDIYLVVEKLEFGKAFWLGSETAVLGNLSVSMELKGHAHGETAPGVPATWGFFSLWLSEGDKQEEFPFSCHNIDTSRFFEWKNYRVDVLRAGGHSKLKVTRIEEVVEIESSK